MSMAPKRKSTLAQNPLHYGASSSSDPSPSTIRFRDDDAFKAFSENFSRRGIHSERQVVLSDFANIDLPSVIHSRGWESLCDVPVTCPPVLIQEFYSNMHGIDRLVPLFFTRVQGTCIPVTPQLVANVLHVPRIKFPDYPKYEHLRIVSRDELMSSFCERPTAWGELLFTPCRPFAKGPLTIYFSSHFILSIIDVHLDSASRDKLTFPSAITRILRHFSVPFSAPSSSGDVSLGDVMA